MSGAGGKEGMGRIWNGEGGWVVLVWYVGRAARTDGGGRCSWDWLGATRQKSVGWYLGKVWFCLCVDCLSRSLGDSCVRVS